VFPCHAPDDFIYVFCSAIQFIEFRVLPSNFRISPAGLEAEDSLILLYLGQFSLQIPYLVFELDDHFPSRLATLALSEGSGRTE
jgi:hypothetical protein